MLLLLDPILILYRFVHYDRRLTNNFVIVLCYLYNVNVSVGLYYLHSRGTVILLFQWFIQM